MLPRCVVRKRSEEAFRLYLDANALFAYLSGDRNPNCSNAQIKPYLPPQRDPWETRDPSTRPCPRDARLGSWQIRELLDLVIRVRTARYKHLVDRTVEPGGRGIERPADVVRRRDAQGLGD